MGIKRYQRQFDRQGALTQPDWGHQMKKLRVLKEHWWQEICVSVTYQTLNSLCFINTFCDHILSSDVSPASLSPTNWCDHQSLSLRSLFLPWCHMPEDHSSPVAYIATRGNITGNIGICNGWVTVSRNTPLYTTTGEGWHQLWQIKSCKIFVPVPLYMSVYIVK